MICSTLYPGLNSRGTSVFTWVSPSDETSFDEDILPLLQYLLLNELVSADTRLGLVEFGSETYHSEDNVTFSAGDYTMEVWTGEPPNFDLNPISENCAKPTPKPASPQSTGPPKKGSGAKNNVYREELLFMVVGTTSVVGMPGKGGGFTLWLAAVVLWRMWRLCLY